MFSIIKPRGDIKSNWESVNPVLRLREWGVEWETSIGIGDVKVKIGDGITHWNDLDYAVSNDVTKKIVKTFATIPENQDNPSIEPGTSLETLFGQVKRKFDYTINFMTTLKNMVGDYQSKSFNTGSGTVTANDLKSAIDILEQYKLTTANILDVNDSTNTTAALSANQGRLLSEQIIKNTSAIDLLNSNFARTNVKQYINLRNEEEIEQQIVKYSGNPGFYVVSTNEPKAHPEFNYSSGFFICRTNTYTLVIFSYDTGTIYIQSGYTANDGYHWSGWHRFVGS